MPPESRSELSAEQERLWSDYLELERGMIRRLMLDGLERFIQSVEGCPAEQVQPWVAALAARVVDDGESIPVRMPLFRRVLMPALREGYRRRRPGYARWLAGFHNLLVHTPEWDREADGRPTRLNLLRRALEDDSEDDLARERLARELANWLDFSVHEVPWGVFSGMNGATLGHTPRLRDALAEFVRLVDATGMHEEYDDLIAECALHFRAYEGYLQHRDAYPDYEAYLDAHEPCWRTP